MKNGGFGLAVTGVWTVCMAVGAEPMALEFGGVGILMTVIGLAMVLYQSYQDEEAAEIKGRRKRLFRTWHDDTDLRKW